MKDPIVTIVARAGGEPELRYLNSGVAVMTVRAAWSHDRRPDAGGEWISENTTWSTIEWWDRAAEHTAELAIEKGDLLRVTGALRLEDFTRRDGTAGSVLKLKADGTPRVWRKKDRAGSATGWTDQQGGAPAPGPARTPENSPGRGAALTGDAPAGPASNGGAVHDDPPF